MAWCKLRNREWALLGLFLLWSCAFIYRSSFPGIDGRRYYCLFDDAMISLRYAWNFAHGNGLVWNEGERIEGYTNFLLTLLMTVPHLLLSERYSVLAIQFFGLVVFLSVGGAAGCLASRFAREGETSPNREGATLLGLGLALGYYPLAYWSLMGMETGLLALLALGILGITHRCWVSRRGPTGSDRIWLWALGSAALLLRSDGGLYLVSATLALVSMPSRQSTRERVRCLLPLLGGWALVALVHLLFRFLYYGELVPNTAVLKLGGVPAGIRWLGGSRFVGEFLRQTAGYWVVALLGLRFCPIPAGMALSMAVPILVYQTYVGGDPWAYWRLLAPTVVLLVPVVAAVLLDGMTRVEACLSEARRASLTGMLPGILGIALVLIANASFLREWFLVVPPFTTFQNAINVNQALAIDQVTDRRASVGVLWGGAIPYYVRGRRAVDFLGKSDRDVARLPVHLEPIEASGGIFPGLITVPGHNKYDLRQSILERNPTFIQAYRWGSQDLSSEVRPLYVAAFVEGFPLLLRKGAAEVDWSKVAQIEPIP